ncbi:MAG TPA: SpoIIE family protein phosphatase, partial [Smithellaceae bacterium]|nr:SpoIIE family protein phosphatase [Smithellaceae bacterium]
FLYSDGVTEASNDRNELFESMGLNTVVGDLKTGDPKALIDGMLSRIEAFAGDEPQADDITMLGIRYYGTER